MVRHTGDLFIELRDHTPNHQCSIFAGERKLCFDRVSDALGQSLEHTLWPSFRHVRVKRKADNLAPGDYLLLVDLELDPEPADDHGPGWSASATGRWQLVRDGIPLAGDHSNRAPGRLLLRPFAGAGWHEYLRHCAPRGERGGNCPSSDRAERPARVTARTGSTTRREGS
jgi:hypothetical protein